MLRVGYELSSYRGGRPPNTPSFQTQQCIHQVKKNQHIERLYRLSTIYVSDIDLDNWADRLLGMSE